VLKAASRELSDVIKVNVYLTDLSNFEVFNDVYREYFQRALSGADDRRRRARARLSSRDRGCR